MSKTLTAVLFLLAVGSSALAQEPPELFKDVDSDQAQRLADYNSPDLQTVLYFASMYRIVEVDAALLLTADEISITLFPGMSRLRLRTESLQRGRDNFSWVGSVQPSTSDAAAGVVGNTIIISARAWDLDKSGNALPSSENRFRQSPLWSIDESGNATLEASDPGIAATIGPPPTTPEDIAWHKRVKSLQKLAFYSTSSVVLFRNGAKFSLRPLKYTPKYAVLYQLDANKVIPARDSVSGVRSEPSQLETIRRQDFESFKAGLPEEDLDRAVRGEIP